MSSPTQSTSLDQTQLNPTMTDLEENPNSDPQNPQTLTLESPDRTPLDIDRDDDAATEDLSATEPDPPSPAAPKSGATSVYRRLSKKKKTKSFHKRRHTQTKKKLEVLIGNLKPIPFVPGKNLDFTSHEKLLRRLGLWEFVHIEFDREIHSDLVAQLIANYIPVQRSTYVKELRVMLNRADLARALKLPVRKPPLPTEDGYDTEEAEATEESIAFILDLVSNWVLLHDDTWMMPSEVLNWIKVIKDGNLEKVDWASMIWFMVEKELMLAPHLGDCYYASHLQRLMKVQRGELLFPKEEEVSRPVVVVVEVDDEPEVEEEVFDSGGDSRMSDAAGVDPGLEEHDTELSLGGRGNVVVEQVVEVSFEAKDSVTELTLDTKESVVEVSFEAKESVAELTLDTKESVVEVSFEAKESVAELTLDTKESVVEVSFEVKESVAEMTLGTEESVVEEIVESVVEKVEEDVIERAVEDEGVIEKVDDEGAAEKESEDFREEEEEEEQEEGRIGDENLMDFEGCKEENDDQSEWPFGQNDTGGEGIILRQCSFGIEHCKDLVFDGEGNQEEEEEGGEGLEEEEDGDDDDDDDDDDGVGQEEEEEHEEEEEEEEEPDDVEEEEEMEEEEEEDHRDFHISSKGLSLDGFSSGALLHSVEASQMNPGPGLAGDFLSSRDDHRMPPPFGNGSTGKRELCLDDDDDGGAHHHPLSSHKRPRIDADTTSSSSCEFDTCMDQIQLYAGKAKMLFAAKEQEAAMNHQIFLNEVHRRDEMLEQLHKARFDDQHRRQVDVYRLDQELHMMSNLLQGYRKALSETQRAFAEYRASNPRPCDSLYKDVPGSGGLVVSSAELEKQRLKREEEERAMRLAIEAEVKVFEVLWEGKFSGFSDSVDVLANKLVGLVEEMKVVKESYAKPKVLEPVEAEHVEA